MVDLNKEIRLSELFRRRRKEARAEGGEATAEQSTTGRRSFLARRPSDTPPPEPRALPNPEPAGRPGRRGASDAGPKPSIPLMRAFDLLPREEPRDRRRRGALAHVAVALLGLVLVAAVGGAYLHASGEARTKQDEVDDLRAQLAEIEVPEETTDAEGGDGLDADGEARTAALSGALADRIAWDRLFREFSLVVPEEVWLTQLTGTTPAATGDPAATPTAPAGGISSPTSLTITGNAGSQETVALLLSRLSSVPEFATVALQSSTRVETSSGPTVQFTIVVGVDPGGTSS